MSRLCRMSRLSKVFGAVVVVAMLALPAVARAQVYESISIKTSASSDPFNMRVRINANGDFSASSLPAYFLLRYAYDLPGQSSRFVAIPMGRGLLDVEAKASAAPAGLSERERWTRMQTMLRAMLADRFKLVMRIDQKKMPVYALTVASGGPKLQKSPIADQDCIVDTSSPDSCHNFPNNGRGHPLNGKAVSMDDLVLYIENWTDLPVVNRTNLNGLFAVDAGGWKPMVLPPRPPEFPQVPNFDDLPSIFTVLGKLGLELKKQDATVPVYVMERFERPAAAQ